ncbi:hypothetical protein ACFUTV_00255 [Streptomyces sp. NPDC057298]|uniref:hypothetical protein n=1 Tax=Streptomyces sp. NPDC057298 TaxID=3346091 RepID=UPI00362CAB34
MALQDLRPPVQDHEAGRVGLRLDQFVQRIDEQLGRRARLDSGGGLLETFMGGRKDLRGPRFLFFDTAGACLPGDSHNDVLGAV